MYEEFWHPYVIQSRQVYDNLLAARRTAVEEYLMEHSMPLTEEVIEIYWRGYRRRLQRQFRNVLHSFLGLHVFAELPIAFLDLNVPAALGWHTKTEQTDTDPTHGYPIFTTTQRTMREYLIRYDESLDGTKVLFCLAGSPHGSGREGRVTAAELDVWKALLESQGFDWNNAGNFNQWRQRLASAVYTS
jgi:hypothetical protein